ncbi:hypothetical protein HanXRQr2_Chr13g0597771 [Helianthus annuus]|uniref:Uncharacterized protein n=1 Tax=Helianthus annuus TaxID=4232 RepID=A0A9K3EIP8_HELAN|nr:hypothetical protein HanXRQr2_Chr13g0597771 [Helianthus annuus]KAJ0850028.1 hypothetical protein HanPSC8_Chr13g0575841 [Helianthus annuus]
MWWSRHRQNPNRKAHSVIYFVNNNPRDGFRLRLGLQQTRAELEEIAISEADVARLKKVVKLHQQPHQQRHNYLHGYLSDAFDGQQHLHNYNSHQRVFQQDFDSQLFISTMNENKDQRMCFDS